MVEHSLWVAARALEETTVAARVMAADERAADGRRARANTGERGAQVS